MSKKLFMDFPKEVTINDVVYKIPQSWDDITIGQYIRLAENKKHDDIGFLAIMLDTTNDVVDSSDVEDLDLIVYGQLDWYAREGNSLDEYLKDKMPESVRIGEKLIPVPKNLKMKSFGQKVSAEQILANSKDKNPFVLISDILAIYFYPDYSGEKFDYDKAMEFRDSHILKIPITKGYPIGTFFLKRLKESLNKKIFIFLENIPKTKKRQILEHSKSLSNLKR